MSAGPFVISRYAASYGGSTAIHPIRVQPETLSADIAGTTNDPPAGALNNPISASASKSKRSFGLGARSITLRGPVTSPPTGYLPGGLTKIPCLTTAFYNLAVKGTEVDYLGVTFTVVSQSPEDVK